MEKRAYGCQLLIGVDSNSSWSYPHQYQHMISTLQLNCPTSILRHLPRLCNEQVVLLGIIAKKLRDFGDKVNLGQELVSTFVVIAIAIPVYREYHIRVWQ